MFLFWSTLVETVLCLLFVFLIGRAQREGLNTIPGSVLTFSHVHQAYVGLVLWMFGAGIILLEGTGWEWFGYGLNGFGMALTLDDTWQALFLMVTRRQEYRSPLNRLWVWVTGLRLLSKSTWK